MARAANYAIKYIWNQLQQSPYFNLLDFSDKSDKLYILHDVSETAIRTVTHFSR